MRYPGFVQSVQETAQLLAAGPHWRPGMGDPTAAGWAITIGYLLGLALCLWNLFLTRYESPSPGRRRHALFWIALSALMLGLGLNKQLDLQTWLWLAGKHIAREQGWYEQRRAVQAIFVGGIGLSGLALLSLFYWLVRDDLRRHLAALLGITSLLSFVSVAAASLHHIDVVLGWRYAQLSIGRTLEAGGVLLVCASALHAAIVSKRRVKKTVRPGQNAHPC